jgi:hypothetical protein
MKWLSAPASNPSMFMPVRENLTCLPLLRASISPASPQICTSLFRAYRASGIDLSQSGLTKRGHRIAYAIAILAQRSQLAISRRGNADARCRHDERRTEGDNAEDSGGL